ncbi:alpha-beta hydrolase superfamily lysophospholipase [Balneicella halophila]|uniref:Alpha-beta hydrolase superfamily lysophospholipase n=2 Tax=Balneicella halophila TaxID=1537566 RepID=A0A7L4USF0_BALHA|nr:alpha-beta hydrolase superfamily lysophospholipase [Balneicella halophila]
MQIKANDGLPLYAYKWMPDNDAELKGILLLIHGSVEHAKRYERFGEFLTTNGIGVYTFDMRGHGETTDLNSPEFAHIAYKTGWEQLLDDVLVVHNQLKKDYPQQPRFLFGHSMGSFLVRDYIANRSADFNGLILNGTTIGEAGPIKLLLKITKFMTLFHKPTYKSKFIHNQVYGNLTKSVENPETPVDFISTDKKEVQKYMDDELSGARISIGYAHEMGKGLLRTRKDETINKIPKELPVLIASGKKDPLGGKDGEQVKALYDKYIDAGINNVTFKLYEGARHEILNEVNRDEVMDDILFWMNKNS